MSLSELREFGVRPMDEAEISQFLATQGVGVLALPDAAAPYALPMSFGYDGEDSLYFTYVLGDDSTKARLSERADRARFLVYTADSPFQWQSVVVTGSIEAIPRDQWDDLALENAWRPALLETADLSGGVAVYRLAVEEWKGVRHTGLPPGLQK
jgi:nitroimidazol reductase NimA-like FMN-containing flavoprotein (pyridoxamine 5'-phosphate oxidase superfamily)